MDNIPVWEEQGLSWGSHIPALIACTAASTGPVLEFGSGNYSTPCLHALCAVQGRELVTVEPEDAWREKFECYASPSHKVLKLVDGLAEELAKQQWGVVFVDDALDVRAGRAPMFFQNAQFMVFHDYQLPGHEQLLDAPLDAWMEEVGCRRYTYSVYGPRTLIISKDHEIPVFCP